MYPKKVFTGFIGKVEVKKIPIVNSWFSALNSVYIDRKSPRDSIKAILQGSENIRNGKSMTIFPEGTRSKDGAIHEFKAGSFKMATRVDAVICPVAIKGTRCLFETPYSLLRKDVYITFLPPLITEGMSEEEKKEVHTIVEERIRAEYDALPSVGKKK
ncbi:MAG: lysophospholipid acyltransferase family protein, partial [Bullifex sp.]